MILTVQMRAHTVLDIPSELFNPVDAIHPPKIILIEVLVYDDN